MNDTTNPASQAKSNSTVIMSLFAALPFLGCSLALLFLGKDSPLFDSLVDMFKTWSAIILAFIGGIRWGSVLLSLQGAPGKMSAATLLPVAGWLALFISGPFGILFLLLIYCAQGAWDSFSSSMVAEPVWYARVRITFFFVIAACHIIAFVAVY